MRNIFVIEEDSVNSRLDRWFKRNICDVPQSLIEKNLRKGNIKVNEKKEKSSYRLDLKDIVSIKNIDFKKSKLNQTNNKYLPTKKDLSLSSSLFIANNENFAVINKPSGIAVQSGTKSKKNIIDILRKTKEFVGYNPYTVHRLDKETTGILIVAKNRKFAQLFTTLFRIRKIHKTYIGMVLGEVAKNSGTFKDNLFYYEGDKKIKTLAITRYTKVDTNYKYTLLKLFPETGRKHQLRKQLLINGTPIFGDTKYRLSENNVKKNSLMLHAYKINFSIDNYKYNFTAELPQNFIKTLKEKNLKSFQ